MQTIAQVAYLQPTHCNFATCHIVDVNKMVYFIWHDICLRCRYIANIMPIYLRLLNE